MKERIREIIDYLSITQAEFANRIGVQRANITHILTGRHKPSLDIIQKILEKFPEINAEWLILGKGEMLKDSSRKNSSNFKTQDLFSSTQNDENNKDKKTKQDPKNNVTNSNNQSNNNLFTNSNTQKNNIENNVKNSEQIKESYESVSAEKTQKIENLQSPKFSFFTTSPDHIIILFDDQTFITYRKRN